MKLSQILRSLRAKIFFLSLIILGGVAVFVMLISQSDVTRTVSASEKHAVSNVMSLVERDIQARWAALLSDKITTVRSGRRQLMETGTTLVAVLDSYAQLAARGIVSDDAAQGMARDWIAGLRLGEKRFAFAYDNNGRVIASARAGDIGQDITKVEDFKGRPLAQAMYDESSRSGHGLAIYRWPVNASDTETRYAYFGHFRPWDWVVVISDDVRDVIAQVDSQREQLKVAMNEALSKLILARSGFLFIAADDETMVVPPPAAQQALLDATDRKTAVTLRERLNSKDAIAALPPSNKLDTTQGTWHIESARFKPLGWTIVAAVPESDLTAPADALIQRQAIIFAIALLLALLATWMIAVRIVRPLGQLTRYSLYLSRHDLKIAPPVPDHITALPELHNDEVGRLASSFMLMDQRLRKNAAELAHETAAREQLERERNVGRAVQLGLLPVPLDRSSASLLDMTVLHEPGSRTGADFHDYFMLADARMCFLVGTVADQGIPAALFATATRTLVRSFTQSETDPAVVARLVNDRLTETNPRMMFATFILGMLNMQTGALLWVNAGHLPPYITDATTGAVRRLQGQGAPDPACGVVENATYTRRSDHVESGECLVIHTEGLNAARDASGTQFGPDQVQSALTRPAQGSHMRAHDLIQTMHALHPSLEQHDDITVLVIGRP